MRWYIWKAWNRTRYYWPQAKARRRAIEKLRADAAKYDAEWNPRHPWWVPW